MDGLIINSPCSLSYKTLNFGRCFFVWHIWCFFLGAHLKNLMETATISCVEGNGIVVLVPTVS